MKRSSTAKAVPTKRQAAGALAKLAKAHCKTEAEIELDAVKVLSRANAAEVERLRAERDALATDAADYQQQVTAARMWTRYERRKRQQEQAQHDRDMAQLTRAKLAEIQQPVQAASTTGDKLPPAPHGMEWVKMRIAMKRLGCSEDTIKRRAKAGAIGYHKTNPAQPRSAAWYAVPIRQQPGT